MRLKLKCPEIYAATNNRNKIEEFRSFFELFHIQFNIVPSPLKLEKLEDGTTLEENAYKKACFLSDKGYKSVFSDDTGLFLPFLDGIPGIFSSRFSGGSATYESNRSKLMDLTIGVSFERRKAYFKTVICFIAPSGETHFFTGIAEGFVLSEERGEYRFGYDPIFLYPPLGRTFGELPLETKNKISHRAKALSQFVQFLIHNEGILF
ncbi:MAG: RdgB/HAM1 family non-canonical purine NTP pyrophosphatase [Candidatus Hydrothermia bacterium]